MAVRSGPGALDRALPSPLWSQLLDDLRGRLGAGDFTTSFPSELALVKEYGVSRHTVREALRHLRGEGLVTAHRGRTPQVVTPRIESDLGALTSLFAAVESRGQEQLSVVRDVEVRTDEAAATTLGLDPQAPLFYLERLRLCDEEPLALDRVWLPAALAEPLLTVDFTHTALYDELHRHCGISLTHGFERVTAYVPTKAERQLLEVPSGEALLRIERIGSTADGPVEMRSTLVRGDRFAVTAAFDKEGHSLQATAE